MSDPTARALALVATAATKATPTQAQFAARVQEVLEAHGDIASEACWQAMARLIAQHWLLLGMDQPPIATWQMLSRCSDTVLKLRRAQKQGQDGSGQDALEDFRRFMGDVAGADDER
jgi:hypothetical protein